MPGAMIFLWSSTTVAEISNKLQKYFGHNIFGLVSPNSVRISSFFGDELILGSYLSRMLPIFFGFLVYINFSKKIYHYIIFFIIFVGMPVSFDTI